MECTDSSAQEETRGVVDSSPIEDEEALLQAARLGRVSDVRYLIKEKGCDRMCRDEDGWTALHWAAYTGHLQVVQCLIEEFGVDPKSCRDDKEQTPLHAAARHGQLSVLRYLIKEKGCDPMSRDENGETALHWAAYNDRLEVVQCLIDEFGMDPKSCQDDEGQTPLHAAARGGQLNVLRYFIKEKGCDPMSRDEDRWTALHWAAYKGHLKVVQCLINECFVAPNSCYDDEDETPLFAAAKSSELSVMKYLIKGKHCSPMTTNAYGWTVLHMAAMHSQLKVVQCLVDECGVDPKLCRDEKKRTALCLAAENGEPTILRYLIKEKGCSPWNQDENGWTVLHKATYKGHLQVVQFLIDECGMNPKYCYDDEGESPLHLAAKCGYVDILRYLIKEKGCNPMSRDDNGKTALHWAAKYNGNLEAVRFLVEDCGACIDTELNNTFIDSKIREYLGSKVPTIRVEKQAVSDNHSKQFVTSPLPSSTCAMEETKLGTHDNVHNAS